MTKIKAKRKLSDITFEHEGAHVSLVSKKINGGPANGKTTLLIKALGKDFTPELVEKASMVTVTLPITEYLRKFFGLWYEDAIVLARIFGYNTDEDAVDDYNDYIENKVKSVSIAKSLVLDKTQEEIEKAVANLSPADYITILEDQQIFEQGYSLLSSVEKGFSQEGVSTENPSEENQVSTEFITKEKFESTLKEAVEKALEAVNKELQAAQEQINKYKEAEKQAAYKARLAKLEGLTSTESAEEIVKSTEVLSDEAFEVIVKNLKAVDNTLEQSELLKEKGTHGAESEEDDDPIQALVKQYTKGKA